MKSRLMAIASEHGRFYFNPQIEIDPELAYGVYHCLVLFNDGTVNGEIDVEETIEDEEEYEEL